MSDLLKKQNFDWSELIVIDTITGDTLPPGHQVINFLSTDKDYQQDPEARAFVEQYLSTAKRFDIDIVEGTIILFDELYNYPGFQHHEFKAFQEFLECQNKVAEYLAFNANWEQVAVRICNGN